MRILIAEDETIIRLALRDMLVRAGFEVCAEARDGEEAVALARSEEPDLAIMDVKMPKLDGIDAARRILEENPIPIVMLTAYGQEELVSRAVEAGVFGYLLKPCCARALRAGGQGDRAWQGPVDREGQQQRTGGVRALAKSESSVAASAEGDCRSRRRDA